MQTVIEKICQMNLLSSLQWSIGNIPSSPKEISALLSKGWITESEAALALEIVAKKQDALSAIKESLDAVRK